MRIAILGGVTASTLVEKFWHFRGTCYLHLQNRRIFLSDTPRRHFAVLRYCRIVTWDSAHYVKYVWMCF